MFLRTLREDPADAETPSHRLLVRAGYIRRSSAGVYTWLPLGLAVLNNVVRVVREEMDRVGGQEVLLPALVPTEYYETTGRLRQYGDLLFRLADRRGTPYVLGSTHEETFTQLAQREVSSYRDLPLLLYQVQTRFRDEPRPRAGLLRGREFLVKDAYSFDVDDVGLQESYGAVRAAYERIFERLGLRYQVVQAMSGSVGGSTSEEFHALAPSGEDVLVLCKSCGYAANAEVATITPPPPVDATDVPPLETLHTPGAPGVDDLVAHIEKHLGGGVSARDILKCVVFTVDGGPVMVLVPGDREVDTERLAAALAPATAEPFGPQDFESRPDLVCGYIGPQGMAERGVRVYADIRVPLGSVWVTGANQAEHHVRYAVAGRDFIIDEVVDVVRPVDGEPCPRCTSPLGTERAIEVAHIVQLGRTYADAFAFDVLGRDGKPVRVTMGCYGIGLSRLVAAIAEQNHDTRGLAWPPSVAPYDVHVVAVGRGEQVEYAGQLAERLADLPMRVLLDDRLASPGVKFADAELIGVPRVVVVGRQVAEGVVELRDRRSGAVSTVPVDRLVRALRGS